MKTRQIRPGKYIWGMGVSLVLLIAGAWLILAPFALGYQAYGASWADQTWNDFWVGIGAVVVALIGFFLFFASLMSSLRAAGVIVARQRPVLAQPQPQVAVPGAFQPAAPMPSQSDLDRTMATLVAALAADLTARRQAASDQPADQQTVNPNTNPNTERREA